VKVLAVDRTAPDAFWLGTAQGGLYRSADGGRSWAPPTPAARFPGFSVTALAPDPVRPATLWIGLTGVVRGGRLLVTEDGGSTFAEVRRWDERAGARAVAVALLGGRRVVAVGGDDGLEISEDGGSSWRASRPPLDPGAGVSFVAFHPARPQLLFAGTFRHPFRSADLGRSWVRIASGMVEDTTVFDLDFASGDPDDFWAATCGWVYRTTDGGTSWVRHREGLADRRTHVVRIDPRNPERILAGTTGGLFESRDAGKSFRRLSSDVVVNALLFDPRRPSRLVMGTESDGVLVSEDSGASFASGSAGLAEARLSAVAAGGDGRVVVARAADGPSGGLWAVDSSSGGAERLAAPPAATVVALVSTGGRLVAATPEGVFVASGPPALWEKTLARPSRALLLNGNSLAAATDVGVFESRDAGRTWARLGSLAANVHALRRIVLPAASGPSLVAESAGAPLVWDRGSWVALDSPGVMGPLSGGFGRPRVVRSPVSVGVEVDETRGLLVFRDETGVEVLVALPEPGLRVAGWTGDPRKERGLFLATVGRGLFRFVPAGS
jgi:photosystem II stability/assembly factor-like uncharacterized protein